MECGCSTDKVQAIHRYLKQHFPDCALRDFHGASRLVEAGRLLGQPEHHVVRITQADVLPYYAVLLDDFLAQPVAEIEKRLWQWHFADEVRAHRIAVAAKDRASAI